MLWGVKNALKLGMIHAIMRYLQFLAFILIPRCP